MRNAIFPSTKSKLLQGPFKKFTDLTKIYEPVACDFTDDLEFASIKKILVDVKYWNTNGELLVCKGRIIDIFTKDKEEFLTMSDLTQIRLDRIFQIEMIAD